MIGASGSIGAFAGTAFGATEGAEGSPLGDTFGRGGKIVEAGLATDGVLSAGLATDGVLSATNGASSATSLTPARRFHREAKGPNGNDSTPAAFEID